MALEKEQENYRKTEAKIAWNPRKLTAEVRYECDMQNFQFFSPHPPCLLTHTTSPQIYFTLYFWETPFPLKISYARLRVRPNPHIWLEMLNDCNECHLHAHLLVSPSCGFLDGYIGTATDSDGNISKYLTDTAQGSS